MGSSIERESAWSLFAENCADYLVLLDPTARIIRANRSIGHVSQEEAAGRKISDLVAPADRRKLEDWLAKTVRTGMPPGSLTAEFLREDGEWRECIAHVEPILSCGHLSALAASFTDITEQKRVEQQLRILCDQLQEAAVSRDGEVSGTLDDARCSNRLATLGTMAAGIAHEINNPLGAILLDAERAIDSADDPEEVRRWLERVIRAVERCALIVKGVLRFSRMEQSEKWPVEMASVLRNVIELTRSVADQYGVRIDASLPAVLPNVLINEMELELALKNLVHNAIYACGEDGQVTVEARSSADHVTVAIRDNGCGMSEEQRRRAFEPLYTTRLNSGGSGLGLTICHGIVTGNSGSIDIDSAVGRGTTVTLGFPIALVEVDHAEDSGGGR